jgi:hypothetical protein
LKIGAEVPGRVLREFRFRVQLYSEWDRRLAPRTRFFGAAALINTALADLCTHRAATLLLSRSTMNFLSKTGRSLESLNVTLADRIHNSAIRADDLDHFMVRTEQNIVERALQSERATNAARFSTVVTQINRLLQLTKFLDCGRSKRQVTLLQDGNIPQYSYAPVLASVSYELRRPVDFASKEDRIRLGRQLINHLRA